VFGIVRQTLFFASEAAQGRVNISPLLSDAAKEAAYEAGFPGFTVHIPYPKPIRPAFLRGGPEPEYVLMQGRQMGRRALFDQLYGPGGEPESVISYQERVRRFQADRTTEFNPGPEVINDSPYAAFRRRMGLANDQPIKIEPACKDLIKELQAFSNSTKSDHVFDHETPLEQRIREIRAKQTPETGSFPINETGRFFETPKSNNPAPEGESESLGSNFEGPDSRPDQD
jgi:hypothetical protein